MNIFGDLTTLVTLAIAVFIFLRLRSVLGKRTGHQRPPFDPRETRPPLSGGKARRDADKSDKVVPLPGRTAEAETVSQSDAAVLPDTGSIRWLSPSVLTRRLGEQRRVILQTENRLVASFRGLVGNARARFDRDAARVTPIALRRRLVPSSEKLVTLARRADRAEATRLERLQGRLTQSVRLLETLSHRAVLERGYALVLNADGALVKRAAKLSKGEEIAVRFADGEIGAVTTGGEATKPKTKPRPAPQAKPSDIQGDLF